MLLKIKCPRCSGPMWEESLPDTQRIIDIVCIICGERKFYNKRKYMEWKEKKEESLRGKI